MIDKFVLSEQFKEKIFEKEYEFVEKISDPEKAGKWWDSLFEKLVKDYPSINRKSNKMNVKLRMVSFLIANRLYFNKIKKIIFGMRDT